MEVSDSHEDDEVMDDEEREALDMSLEDVLALSTGKEARLARTEPERIDSLRRAFSAIGPMSTSRGFRPFP